MRKLICFLLLATCGVVTLRAATPGLVVKPISRDGQVLVSVELSDAMTPEVKDGIQAGLSTTFSYEIDVRRGAGLFARSVASVTLAASVRFDNLTRVYQLSRTVDGREQETRPTDDQEAMRRWLTRFDLLPVVGTSSLEANAEYAVRVRVQTIPHNAWFYLPWDRNVVSGNAKFTFIP